MLHQLTQNMTKDCSWNYHENYECSAHVLPMFCVCSFLDNSMNNLLSYCGLIDAKIRASDKDLPVFVSLLANYFSLKINQKNNCNDFKI